ncbi:MULTISPECIES: hypothetical protein [unclassified Microbacterium]|uniref:hypothetical protein n=1 Tax=unclassified Microbacterium TaxID=2609290 RepID=UPI002469C092|nr:MULTISPECIES: hypothetical protein [unclassified Microbacterium]MDH5133843.1 hypothetical protein [Microbacterium sp. RD10]MDH5138400.1 hypothetical protein [Microbacterium sp. RD11]MDH5144853.1 hypothetical protein [Microbacterium sp. RD12]MDH5156400.1 hypothetical protein [Microbacterium sp. RD06]
MRTSTRRSALALWIAFLLVHLVTAWLGWVYPSQPMGDVVLVYEPWATAAWSGGEVVGVTESWVYPQLALLPMMLAAGLAAPFLPLLGVSGAYLIGWALLVTALDALAFAVLVGRGRVRARRTAAWFWCAALLLLGPIALYRIDAVTVPLAVVAGLWLVTRPTIAAALLTIGAWIKIWPGALLLAAVVAGRARLRMLLTAAGVTAGVVVALLLLGADTEILGFLTAQTGRGLQIEAVAATPFLWMAVTGAARIEYSYDILTFQIVAPGAEVVSTVLTPLLALAVVVVALAGGVKAARGASFARLFPPLALLLVTVLIALNKVGSPQFQTWLLAPVILWLVLDRRRARAAAALVLALCLLTCLVYPLSYDGLLRAEAAPVLLLTMRNVLLVILAVVSAVALARVPVVRRPRTQE